MSENFENTKSKFQDRGRGGTMKYHRVLGSTGLNDRSRLTGETTEPRWMERMREVLNEFMRFMNPHLLSARLYLNSYFPRFLRIEQIFSHERGKRRIFDRVRNVTNLWRFTFNRFVIRRRKRSLFEVSWLNGQGIINLPNDNRWVPTVYPLFTSRKGEARSSRYNNIFPPRDSKSLSLYKFLQLRCISRKLIIKPLHILFLIRKDDKQGSGRRRRRGGETTRNCQSRRTTKGGRGFHLKRIGKSIRSTHLSWRTPRL